MDEYPGNSRKRLIDESAAAEEAQEPKLEKVVTGKVVQRKKSLGRRFMDTMFSGDSDSVVGYLAKEVLLPAVKNLITEFVTEGIHKALYGEASGAGVSRRPRPGAPRTHINYSQPSPVVRPSAPTRPVVRRPVTQPSVFDMGEIVFDSRADADAVIERLYDTIETYRCVTVGNLNELLGKSSTFTDNKWGWTDLADVKLRRISEGYLLVMPEPEDLR